MSDPTLPFLIIDAVALLLLGLLVAVVPKSVIAFLNTMLCGLGALLCLPPLMLGIQTTTLEVPIGPPGISLRFNLDSLSLGLLFTALVAGAAVAAFQAMAEPAAPTASARVTSLAVAGTILGFLAADGVSLAVGLSIACGAMWEPGRFGRMVAPWLALAAVCMLTPPGYAPWFDAIRLAPIEASRSIAAAVLAGAAAACLVLPSPKHRCWVRDGLAASLFLPLSAYLPLRLVTDLCGTSLQETSGVVFVLGGGVTAVAQAWSGASEPGLDTATAALVRRQAGLVAIAIGLAIIARVADLPKAAVLALDAASLTVVGATVAATLVSLAAHTIGQSAGTYRLSRLGGLIHTMPVTTGAMSAGLLALSALPPGVGFAGVWLMFQSIVSAPRTGGLLPQIVLALGAAALALSAALATAASVRLAGIALLGRPRTPSGAGAREQKSPLRALLLTLGGVISIMGLFPGPVLGLIAMPAAPALAGIPINGGGGTAVLSMTRASGGYLALPVAAVLTLAILGVALAARRHRREAKPIGPWLDGMRADVNLPFGEPHAQSAGIGFVPPLPPLPPLPKPPDLTITVPPPAVTGPWLVLAGFGVLLLFLAVAG